MKITKLSKSAIECYKACEWQYFLQYICKIQTPGSLSNVSGNIVHSVAEILAKQNKNGKINNGSKRNDPYWLLDV
ncbi:hypothetical protein GM547_14090, partial [Streptococcus pneumoniae]|uniref:PD-(D/E)XK nuclease family protein n=1 Tax=Streptococcus pneumoniae TaxID=1313 RepID=UPI0012D7CDC0